MNDVQNGDINHRIQVIEQNGKDIPFIYIDSLRRLLPILNRYIEKYRYIEILDIEVDDTIRYRNDISIFSIYRPISNWNGTICKMQTRDALSKRNYYSS